MRARPTRGAPPKPPRRNWPPRYGRDGDDDSDDVPTPKASSVGYLQNLAALIAIALTFAFVVGRITLMAVDPMWINIREEAYTWAGSNRPPFNY